MQPIISIVRKVVRNWLESTQRNRAITCLNASKAIVKLRKSTNNHYSILNAHTLDEMDQINNEKNRQKIVFFKIHYSLNIKRISNDLSRD